jgi:serine/threonine-protein kinase
LPTEAEWEIAARAPGKRRFPWGDERPTCERVVFGRTAGMPCAAHEEGPATVGSAPGDVTPEGVHDLGGNVREWVADAFVEHYPACSPPCRDPGRDDEPKGGGAATRRAVRGGGWWEQPAMTRAARRGSDEPGWTDVAIGFRCARALR